MSCAVVGSLWEGAVDHGPGDVLLAAEQLVDKWSRERSEAWIHDGASSWSEHDSGLVH